MAHTSSADAQTVQLPQPLPLAHIFDDIPVSLVVRKSSQSTLVDEEPTSNNNKKMEDDTAPKEKKSAPDAYDDTAIDTSDPMVSRWPEECKDQVFVIRPATSITYQAPLKPQWGSLAFKRFWHQPPIEFLGSDFHVDTERHFEGTKFRLTVLPNRIEALVKQGSVFTIVHDDTYVKYIATWKRGSDRNTVYVELVAYTEQGTIVEPYHSAWPTILLVIPRTNCGIKYAPAHEDYLRKRIHRIKTEAAHETYMAEQRAKHRAQQERLAAMSPLKRAAYKYVCGMCMSSPADDDDDDEPDFNFAGLL